MESKLYDNADSFAISFDHAWDKVNCEDLSLKIEKVIELISDHPFVVSNQDKAFSIAKFRVFSLKKFQ